MSTILKALNKLEHELPDQSDTLPGSRKSTTKQTISRRAKRFRRFHKSFWIVLGLLSLAAAGWFVLTPLSSRPRQSLSASKTEDTAEIAKKRSLTSNRQKQKLFSDQMKKLQPDIPVPDSRLKKKTAKKDLTLKPATSVMTVKPSESVQARRAPIKVDAKPVSAQPLEDSKLKLQAISWSEKPENRIAVINSNIVREGELIEGFRVIQIGQDDVLVRADAKEWKLVFGLK